MSENTLKSEVKKSCKGYTGVYYRDLLSRSTKKPDRVFYVQYYSPDGKRVMERVGSALTGLTPAKANLIRARRIEGRDLSNVGKRLKDKKEKENITWTFRKIWETYRSLKGSYRASKTDYCFYTNYLSHSFGNREPSHIVPLDIDRLRFKLERKDKLAPETVKHVLALLKRLHNFAMKKALCPGISFTIELPVVNNIKTEDLSNEQLNRLMSVLNDHEQNPQITTLMRLALLTGMRKGELIKLEWSDINYEKKFILIRDPKGKKDQRIPLNKAAKHLLNNHNIKTHTKCPAVFLNRKGTRLTDPRRQINRIKKLANLPENFRPLHGLRHVFASMLASSGKVDMYTLQKLLTHKSPMMTQRYAHLRDETLKQASEVAGDIIDELQRENQKLIDFKEPKKSLG
jgi:integrase